MLHYHVKTDRAKLKARTINSETTTEKAKGKS